jgi:hypothetical protein
MRDEFNWLQFLKLEGYITPADGVVWHFSPDRSLDDAVKDLTLRTGKEWNEKLLKQALSRVHVKTT